MILNISYSKKLLILKIYLFLIVFQVFIAATISRFGIPSAMHITSILPYLLTFTLFVIVVKDNFFKFSKVTTLIWLFIFMLGIFYSAYALIIYDDISYLASFKTFFIMTLMYIILHMTLTSMSELEKFKEYLFLLSYIIVIYTIIEFIMRMTPALNGYFRLVFDYVSVMDVAGLGYLVHGDGFGILPLGIFLDAHTHASAISIIALFSFIEKKRVLFVLSIIALIVAVRMTSIIAFTIGYLALIMPIWIFLFICIISPFIIHFVFSGQNSYDTIYSHFINNFEPYFNQNIVNIIFGNSYTRSDYISSLGYNEIFLVEFLFSFGFIGVLLLCFFSIYILYNMKKIKIDGNFVKYDKLGIAMIIMMLLDLLHYNLFFNPIVLFIYMFIIYYSKQMNYYIKVKNT